LIDHFNIRAPITTIERVKKFYQVVFEFEVGERPSFNSIGFWLYDGDRALIHLSVCEEVLLEPSSGYLDHIAIRSSGLKAFCDRLNAHKVSFRAKYLPDVDMTQLFFHDPSNLKIEANFPNERLSK